MFDVEVRVGGTTTPTHGTCALPDQGRVAARRVAFLPDADTVRASRLTALVPPVMTI